MVGGGDAVEVVGGCILHSKELYRGRLWVLCKLRERDRVPRRHLDSGPLRQPVSGLVHRAADVPELRRYGAYACQLCIPH